MNEQDHAELERLNRRQETLQMQLANLTVDIERLASRVNAAAQPAPEISPLEIPPLETTSPVPPPLPPVIPEVTSRTAEAPPPIPREKIFPEPVTATATEARETFAPPVEIKRDSSIQPVVAPPEIPTPKPRETFEMKLGTYWLVRVGIVMLLTGLVFLGTYAYKNFIGKFGPAGKVAMLYTASAALLGFGGWLQRKREKESLRNYGQVLFAGGLAAVYFTTYAAHYLPVLRVIESPFIDALLLMAWAAATVWIADRRKSEVLALFAVGLAYYTSAITDIGIFTLGANLVLTATAVFFLVRNRWTTLSFVSVLATYGSFAFWRFHYGDWSWDARTTELWNGNFFLAGYWLFFTAAVFLARGKSIANANRALFASMNNGAFFALVLLSMMRISHGHFWIFALAFGAVLLGAAFAARIILFDETFVKNAYLVQGLTLITLGFIAQFAGLKLSLILAAESVVLTFLGHQEKNIFVRSGGYVTAALSFAWVSMMMTGQRNDIIIGAAIGAAFLLNAWRENRSDERRNVSALRASRGYFVALALSICGIVTWHAVPEEWRAVAWMIEALAFTALFYVVRIPELPLFSQALALLAQGCWFFEFALRQNKPHWLVPATLVAGTLALSHWWQRQKRLALMADVRNALQIVYALALVGVIFFWFQPKFAPAAWLAFLCALAIGLTIYGVVTRAWPLAACAQLFLLISSAELIQQFLREKPEWIFALVPIATWLLLGVVTTAWLSRHETADQVRRPLLQVSVFYRGVAFLMSLWWIYAYVPAQNYFWVLCLLGIALTAFAGWRKNREALVFAGLFVVVAFIAWFTKVLTDNSIVNWPNALAMLSLLAAQQAMRRLPQRYELPAQADNAIIFVTGVALWAFLSRWVVLTSGANFLLTASWAGLAALFFALGFLLRERMHRWLGLGILACAVCRVFLSDVWKLETIYRILSFMALGVVLLALGFVYNKYQEKIRQWL